MGEVLEERCGRERRRGGDGQRGAHRAQGLGLHPVLCWGGGAGGGAPSWSFGLPPTPLSPYLGTHFPHGLKWAFSECQGLENMPRVGEKAAPRKHSKCPHWPLCRGDHGRQSPGSGPPRPSCQRTSWAVPRSLSLALSVAPNLLEPQFPPLPSP